MVMMKVAYKDLSNALPYTEAVLSIRKVYIIT